jgi:hypothetical protein
VEQIAIANGQSEEKLSASKVVNDLHCLEDSTGCNLTLASAARADQKVLYWKLL